MNKAVSYIEDNYYDYILTYVYHCLVIAGHTKYNWDNIDYYLELKPGSV